jgi:hypothetical protein
MCKLISHAQVSTQKTDLRAAWLRLGLCMRMHVGNQSRLAAVIFFCECLTTLWRGAASSSIPYPAAYIKRGPRDAERRRKKKARRRQAASASHRDMQRHAATLPLCQGGKGRRLPLR